MNEDSSKELQWQCQVCLEQVTTPGNKKGSPIKPAPKHCGKPCWFRGEDE